MGKTLLFFFNIFTFAFRVGTSLILEVLGRDYLLHPMQQRAIYLKGNNGRANLSNSTLFWFSLLGAPGLIVCEFSFDLNSVLNLPRSRLLCLPSACICEYSVCTNPAIGAHIVMTQIFPFHPIQLHIYSDSSLSEQDQRLGLNMGVDSEN